MHGVYSCWHLSVKSQAVKSTKNQFSKDWDVLLSQLSVDYIWDHVFGLCDDTKWVVSFMTNIRVWVYHLNYVMGVQFLPLIMSCPIPMFCIIHLVEPRHTMITCVLFMRWQRTEMYNRVYHTDITIFISCLHEQLLNKVTSDNKNLVNKRSKDHICEKWILINFQTSLKFEMWK